MLHYILIQNALHDYVTTSTRVCSFQQWNVSTFERPRVVGRRCFLHAIFHPVFSDPRRSTLRDSFQLVAHLFRLHHSRSNPSITLPFAARTKANALLLFVFLRAQPSHLYPTFFLPFSFFFLFSLFSFFAFFSSFSYFLLCSVQPPTLAPLTCPVPAPVYDKLEHFFTRCRGTPRIYNLADAMIFHRFPAASFA